MSDIDNIKSLVLKFTPDFISNPIIKAAIWLELFRLEQAAKAESEAVSFIFSNEYAFYGILAVLAFLILRFIWRLIF